MAEDPINETATLVASIARGRRWLANVIESKQKRPAI
jgi:hypothetical protein